MSRGNWARSTNTGMDVPVNNPGVGQKLPF
jgi:hypothetical protein